MARGETGERACDHYHRWREDLDLMRELGLKSYRFSVAWPRVMPAADGVLNARGLDFYERLVDGLLERGIAPNLTLYHWDLPQVLEDRGGWLERGTALAFADYAAAVLKRLGDRVELWSSFNEPQVFLSHGYGNGVHAPGRRESRAAQAQASHHVLLAHGLAMGLARKLAPRARMGLAHSPAAIWPATGSPADLEACRRHWEDSNDWWVGSSLSGRYPAAALERLGAEAPRVEPGDMATVGSGLDFIGLNYYVPARTAADPARPGGYAQLGHPAGAEQPDFPGWEIFPAGLENLLVQFARRYPGLDLYVTENGTSLYGDAPDASGRVADPRRVRFLARHLAACRRAIDRGAPLKGYYAWSLLDNFEWALGYQPRFGLLHVDYASFKRSPKDSFRWYQALIRENALEAPEPDPCPDFRFFEAPAPGGEASAPRRDA